MLSIVKGMAGKTKDPSWLYLMPWVHFLSGESSPFETQGINVSHDNKEPIWWGIQKIKDQVQDFKGKASSWAM